MRIRNEIIGGLGRRLKITTVILAILIACGPSALWAHPHAFVSCTVSFVMDEAGLVGCHQRWILDAMTTVAVLDVVDTDRNTVLSDDEQTALSDLTVESLRDFHYFTAIRVNGHSVPVKSITHFSAEVKANRLVYDFLVPCRVAATPNKRQQVKVAVFDDSFYTYVAYAAEDEATIDPSQDPMFANREAPASPGDYERFAKAVGVAKFNGKIRVTGNTQIFKIETKVEDAADMAYFHNQIIPQAAVMAFEPK
ncbi:putative uncharacterized ABC transporter, periplasmic binding protein [Desulfosarcina variabilis str. Montpellier]|uniref:DUF1007 family protein n=1 Tax=Desulfosarcina variabilis TaxID=2300 RepID=UPI003AFB2A44